MRFSPELEWSRQSIKNSLYIGRRGGDLAGRVRLRSWNILSDATKHYSNGINYSTNPFSFITTLPGGLKIIPFFNKCICCKANLKMRWKDFSLNSGNVGDLCYAGPKATYFWLMNWPNLSCQKLRDLGWAAVRHSMVATPPRGTPTSWWVIHRVGGKSTYSWTRLLTIGGTLFLPIHR